MQRSIIAPAERVTNLRWGIALLLGIGILVTSFDRINLIVSGSALRHELGIGTVGFGYLLGVFGWTYAAAQIPAGLLVDRYGVTVVGRISAFVWSIVALLAAAAGSLGMAVAACGGLGLAKAPTLPLAAKATGYWFPTAERSTATAIFDAGGKLGVALALPLLSILLTRYGWRATFLLLGVAGFAFFVAFFVFYRDPAAHRGLTHAEGAHLRSGDAQAEGAPARGSVDATFAYLLVQPKVWGLKIGFAAYGFSFFLLLTWLPEYLVRTFGMTVLGSGIYTSIPWLAAALSSLLVGGVLVDALIRRGLDATRVRKTILVAGMLAGLSIFGATTTHDPNVAIAYIALAFAGLAAAAPVAWSIPALIAPRGAVASLAALVNCAQAVMALIAPIVAGYVVAATGSFTNVFLIAAAVLAIGILSYIFLLGKIEPIPEPA